MTTLILGINNCFAVKRWPEPEEWARIVAEELGLKQVQFSFDLLDPRSLLSARKDQVAKIQAACSRYGLQLHSTFTGLAAYSWSLLLHPSPTMRLDAVEWYRSAVDLTGELGARATGGHLGALSLRDFQDQNRGVMLMNEFRASLHDLARQAKGAGAEYLLWETMPVSRERPSKVEDALALNEWANDGSALPILFCLDTGHTCAYDSEGVDLDPYYWIRKIGRFSPVIHIQQSDGKGDHHWPFTPEYNAQGIVDAPRVIEAAHASGAEKIVLMLEVIHAFETRESQVLNDLRTSVEYWKKALAA